MTQSFLPRLLALSALIGLCLASAPVVAQAPGATLFLRPHCISDDASTCPGFPVRDPQTLVTPQMQPGDTLDLDIVLQNPAHEAIHGIRVWLSYDADVLQGQEMHIGDPFPAVTPGQSDFSPLSGYVKIAAEAEDGKEPQEPVIVLARVTFAVVAAPAADAPSPISFYDLQEQGEGHTAVATVSSPDQNLIAPPLGSLLVDIAPRPEASSASATPQDTVDAGEPAGETDTAAMPGADLAQIAPAEPQSDATASDGSTGDGGSASVFALLQVQNVRVGTRDASLYVSWDPLSHPRLQGYNVYYGTRPGSYLQRHAVSLAARGTVIRDLPEQTTYYVAVRAVDDGNRESAFSAEASVEIGNPSTSSSPITGNLEIFDHPSPQIESPENPLQHDRLPLSRNVPGDAGAPSGIALLILGSAAVGTLLAFRRQFTAATRLPA